MATTIYMCKELCGSQAWLAAETEMLYRIGIQDLHHVQATIHSICVLMHSVFTK